LSDLSKYEPETPANWSVKIDMAGDTLLQVEKDFALHGEEIAFSHVKLDSYNDVVHTLAIELERKEFLESSKLAAILYQIDLRESNLVMEINQLEPQYVYLFLADKILKRCFEKVYWRYKMRENR